jgi:hypothetical protein
MMLYPSSMRVEAHRLMHRLNGGMEIVMAEGLIRQNQNQRGTTELKRRYFIGGSDAPIIMGNDEAALVRL